jgi:hypothetical protein
VEPSIYKGGPLQIILEVKNLPGSLRGISEVVDAPGLFFSLWLKMAFKISKLKIPY